MQSASQLFWSMHKTLRPIVVRLTWPLCRSISPTSQKTDWYDFSQTKATITLSAHKTVVMRHQVLWHLFKK